MLSIIQFSHASKSSECSTCNRCDRVVAHVSKQVIQHIAQLPWHYRVTYNLVRLPRPVNAPLAIDVIWLPYRDLHRQNDEDHTDGVLVQRGIQFRRVSKTSECAAGNRCDLVVGHNPMQPIKLLCATDKTVSCHVQLSQASKPSECATRNRRNVVVTQFPAQVIG